MYTAPTAMNIILNNTGKRYNREWIFRNLNYNFSFGSSYAITGANGSGKSTLLQIIAGASLHSEGVVEWTETPGTQKKMAAETAYLQIAFAAPYLELIEEFTANEMLAFHAKFKPLTKNTAAILQTAGLYKAANKQIRYYSSGMKQRLKLAQAFFSNTPVLLLDEPTTNLDEEGIALYEQLIQNHTAGRLVIVSSNDKREYAHCRQTIYMQDYK